jgi:transposase-like protein
MEHLYCELCQLQFDKQLVFDLHLSFVHKDNQIDNGSTLSKEESVEDIKEKSDEDIKEEALEDIYEEIVLSNVETDLTENNTLVYEPKISHEKLKCTTYSHEKGLKRHLKTAHSNEKFKCTTCNKSYSNQEVFKRHLKFVHSNEKFKCSTCNKSYSNKDNLNRHMKFVHVNDKSEDKSI